MLLHNLSIIGSEGMKDIFISGDKIQRISSLGNKQKIDKNEISITFNNALAFPGLINSHDHLDFNLFPQIGNKIYNNYVEWGQDIHRQNKKEINQVLRIPKDLRVKWGIYKNLLNGVTTVVNHGSKLVIEEELINIFQQGNILHSAGFEKGWRWKINSPFARQLPFVIHVGEGSDRLAYQEINRVIRWNLYKRKIIGIHGVAMDKIQAKYFNALVWCPGSNFFLMNKTASIDQLKDQVRIVFGTDSTLTSTWNLWEQLRMARNEKCVSDPELLDMLSTGPAQTWQLKNSGELKPGNYADIVIANQNKDINRWDAFFSLNPEDLLLIIHRGNIRLFDESLINLIDEKYSIRNFSKILICGKAKWVEGDLQSLMQEIKKHCPSVQFPISCC